MDLSDVYLVVVRLPGWEFMASASHINANKAVRGLAAAGDGTLAPGTKLTDQEMTVHIGGAPDKITKRFCFANVLFRAAEFRGECARIHFTLPFYITAFSSSSCSARRLCLSSR